jgi:hypothetical protein
MTDNTILARAKALLYVRDGSDKEWLGKVGAFLGDIIAALEEPDADLVSLLARLKSADDFAHTIDGWVHAGLHKEAADLIERQRLRLAEAGRKLRDVACSHNHYESIGPKMKRCMGCGHEARI